MPVDIPNPWLEVAKQKNPPYLAKCDWDIKLADFYSLRVELLPQPYIGKVLSAKVICLLLNPGCGETEENVELDCQEFQQALRDNLDPAKSRLVHLDNQFDWTNGGKWLRQKIVNPLASHGVTRDDLDRNFAIIEYFPYHSKSANFNLSDPLESQRYGFELVRQAIRNNAIILIMRSEKLWFEAVPELASYRQTGNCILAHSSRNAILSEANLGAENFTKVIKALKS